MEISDIRNDWRARLIGVKASFRGVIFHVENEAMSSGRRTVVHEYPKRNTPYAEDMGRHARRMQFSGYLIHSITPGPGMSPYVIQRDALRDALDQDDAGRLVHPVFCPGGMMVMCERYSMTENRERGGYSQFDMSFVDAGSPGNSQLVQSTAAALQMSNTQTSTQIATQLNLAAQAASFFTRNFITNNP